MMSLSRQEVNLRRLLAKCELMYKNKEKHDDKVPQYIETLEKMLLEVKQLTAGNSFSDSLQEYERRILALKVHLGLVTDSKDNGDALQKLTAREELLGLRQRNVQRNGPENLDELILHQQNLQESIAGDMLILTQNLKGQSELANRIIKKDTEVLHRSTQLTEQNFSKIKTETEKLGEHSKRAWKCWLWVMLIIVMVVFINMVLFMKVVKKK